MPEDERVAFAARVHRMADGGDRGVEPRVRRVRPQALDRFEIIHAARERAGRRALSEVEGRLVRSVEARSVHDRERPKNLIVARAQIHDLAGHR